MKRKWIVLLCAVAVAACSKEPNSEPGPGGTVPIELSAGMQAHQSTKAPIEGDKFPEMTPAFRLTATQGTGDAAPTDWTSPYFSDKEVNSAADGTLSWPEGQKRYYPAGGQKLYFYAYTPKGASVTAGTQTEAPRINYTITGSQDIMWAANTQGIKPDGAVADPVQLTFSHKLMQVRFKVAKSESFPIGEGETFAVTSIKIKDIRVVATLDLGSGALVFPEAEPKGTLIAYANGTGIALGDEAAEVPSSVMFEPQATFTCEVTAGGMTYPDVKVTLSGEGAGQAGVGHTVTLTFKQGEISATATIAEWTDGGEGTTGEDYPVVLDGNIIAFKDFSGEADPSAWPTHTTWLTTPAHTETAIDENTSGFNTVTEQFIVARNYAVGPDETSESMTWYEASGVKEETHNPEGYSACAWYYEDEGADDIGLWRLPTARELKAIGRNNKYLKGTAWQTCWAATASNDASAYVYKVEDETVEPSVKDAELRVRCVRDPECETLRQYPIFVNQRLVIVKTDRYGGASSEDYPTHRPCTYPIVNVVDVENVYSELNPLGEKYIFARNLTTVDGTTAILVQDAYDVTTTPPTDVCGKYYYERPDKADLGKWRLPTLSEIRLFWIKNTRMIKNLLPADTRVMVSTKKQVPGGFAYMCWYWTGNDGHWSWTLDPSKWTFDMHALCVRDVGDETPATVVYPYVASGNTVVVKDAYGEADPVQYPTHEPWTTTPSHEETAWDANESGLNIIGERFQVAKANAKGKDGSSETMTWYEASGTTNTSYNPDGYSACSEYSEEADQSDKRLWRLPTIQELKLIVDKKAQLIVVNLPSSFRYMSATGYNSSDNAWNLLYGSSGMTVTEISKTMSTDGYVRCVKDL